MWHICYLSHSILSWSVHFVHGYSCIIRVIDQLQLGIDGAVPPRPSTWGLGSLQTWGPVESWSSSTVFCNLKQTHMWVSCRNVFRILSATWPCDYYKPEHGWNTVITQGCNKGLRRPIVHDSVISSQSLTASKNAIREWWQTQREARCVSHCIKYIRAFDS